LPTEHSRSPTVCECSPTVRAGLFKGLGLTEAYKEIRYLNAIMHNKYSRVPEKLRAWKSATHIERAPEWRKKDAPPAPSPAPPTP
jgi:hypothetical protein